MGRRVADIEALLRERGFSLTPQRRAIVRCLAERGGHWTASELLAELPRELPMASRATVYSTVSLLRELGVVTALPTAGGEVRFDSNPDPHHHLLCTRCGRLEDVPLESLPVAPRADVQESFQIEGFRVVAEGLCGSCR